LYGCKTWSLTGSEEHILRVLRRIFGPKREEMLGGWRRLDNEELHNLYVSPNIINMIESRRFILVGHVARIGEMKNSWKSEGNRPLARSRRWCGDNIRMDLSEIGWKGVDWIHLGQDSDQWRALASIVMNFRVP